MSPFEQVAAGTYLSYWPDDINFQVLITRLKEEEFGDDEDSIDPVEWMFGYPGEFLAEQINDLKETLKRNFEIYHEPN